MSKDTVHLQVEEPVATVSLARPDVHNAFEPGLIARLSEIFIELAHLPEVRVVVLAGSGKSFCAGADLQWMQQVASYGDAEIPLPTPERLKEEAVAVCRTAGDDEAAEALAACDLSYAVAQGEGIEQFIEVVIAAPDDVFEALQDHGNPITPGIMGALLEVCPNLGSDRVVRKQ